MRKFFIPAALLASTIAVAAPAAAQWAPPVPQGYAYGYHDNYGQMRRLQVRIDQLQRQIMHLDRRNILTNSEARKLRSSARELEIRIRRAGHNGISPRERMDIERRLSNLEYRIERDARDGNRYGRNNYGWSDRDRDGRNDRWEDDRGRRHD